MDYKEKYNAALERANVAHKDEDRHLKATLERIFPELKESGDEKMRESIIYALRNGGFYSSDKTDEAIAWLEKQDHMIDTDKLIEWIKHYNITDCDVRTSIIPDSSPTSNPHFVRWFSDGFINRFKKDFGL